MSSSKPTHINPPGHPPFSPYYSHVSIAPITVGSKLIHFAGQIGYDPVTELTPPDFASQIAIALANVDKCLHAASAAKDDIVHVRQYIPGLATLDPADKKIRSQLYSEYMGDNRAPVTLIGVQSLATPELLFEIEVVAVVNG